MRFTVLLRHGKWKLSMDERSPVVRRQAGYQPHWLWVAAIILVLALESVIAAPGPMAPAPPLASQADQPHGSWMEASDRATPWALLHRSTQVSFRDGRRTGPEVPITDQGKHALLPSTPTSLTARVSSAAVAPILVTIAPSYPCHSYSSQAPPSLTL